MHQLTACMCQRTCVVLAFDFVALYGGSLERFHAGAAAKVTHNVSR